MRAAHTGTISGAGLTLVGPHCHLCNLCHVCNPAEQSLRADRPDPGDRNIDGPFGLNLPEAESGAKPTTPNSFPERRESKYPAGKQFWADKEMR